MRIPSGVTDQYGYFVAFRASDRTTRQQGMGVDLGGSGHGKFVVYRSRNGGALTAMTTPTVASCGGSAPGVYALLLDEDMTIDAGDYSQEMTFHITTTDTALSTDSIIPVTASIELYDDRMTVATGGIAALSTGGGHVADLVETLTTNVAAIETSITYATKGIQDEIIPRLITATGQLATLATGTQHEFASIENKLITATTGINAIELAGGATATAIANAVMNQTTADHQTDGTFAGDVFGMLESATDQISALAAAVQVVDNEVAAIETSITYATKGVQDDIIPRLITATGQLATLAKGTQHEFASIENKLITATTGINAIQGSSGATATEIANAVMNQTLADHIDASQFAGGLQNRLVTATTGINAVQTTQAAHTTSLVTATTGINAIEASSGATATEIANAVMNQTSADHTLDGTFAGDVLGSLQSATDQISALATGGGATTPALIATLTADVAAIETSITYATKGIDAVQVTQTAHSASLSTATTGVNDIQNKASTATTGINAVQATQALHSASLEYATDTLSYLATGGGPFPGGGAAPTATEIANAVMGQTSADHTLDGTFAGDVLGMLQAATDGVSALATGGGATTPDLIATLTSNVSAIETSITYATKGIQDEVIPRLVTATGQLATLATGTQHEFSALRTGLATATDSIAALATGGGEAADAVGALNDISVADVLTTQMTEAYAVDGAAPTLAQALFLIQQQLGDFSISGTTLTVKKLDGSTDAAAFTLNNGTSPTSITRSS